MRLLAAIAAASAIATVAARPRSIELRLRPRLPAGLVAGCGAAASTAIVARSLGAPAVIAIAAGTMVAPVPGSIRRSAARRAAMRVAARWPDYLAAVRSRIATGSSLGEAIRAAARHLGGRFLDLDRGPVEPLGVSLHTVRDAWADPLTDRVLTTLGIAAEVGGRHVDTILGALAESIAEEVRLRQAHEANLTQQRLTAGVALIAPWALLALSIATNPTAAESYSTPTGTWIVLGGLAATVSGFVLARRSARLSESPRVFT